MLIGVVVQLMIAEVLKKPFIPNESSLQKVFSTNKQKIFFPTVPKTNIFQFSASYVD